MKIEQWFLYFIFICTIFFYNGISCKTKTGRHDIAEILPKVALSTIKLAH
jgi:hypothetical protein